MLDDIAACLRFQQCLYDCDGDTIDQPHARQRSLVRRLDVGRDRVQPFDALASPLSPDVVAVDRE